MECVGGCDGPDCGVVGCVGLSTCWAGVLSEDGSCICVASGVKRSLSCVGEGSIFSSKNWYEGGDEFDVG